MNEPWPVGMLVEKINSERGDAHQNGARGRLVKHIGLDVHVMGPLCGADASRAGVPSGTYGYFVEWDDMPGLQIGVTSNRIRPVRLRA